MHSTQYRCGNCNRRVSRTARVCPHCKAQLRGIKCQNCGFSGSAKDFLGDRCPECGSIVKTTAAPWTCKCGERPFMFCEDCGGINWKNFVLSIFFGILTTTVTALMIIESTYNPNQTPQFYLILTTLSIFSFFSLLFLPVRTMIRRRRFQKK